MVTSAAGRAIQLQAMIDTGADATIVPVRYLRQIGAQPAFEASLRSHWGERRPVFLYLVDLKTGGLTLPSVFVVGDDRGDETILGRDVLNKLVVTLHGPQRLTEIVS
jgi:predicted aspartyl protease